MSAEPPRRIVWEAVVMSGRERGQDSTARRCWLAQGAGAPWLQRQAPELAVRAHLLAVGNLALFVGELAPIDIDDRNVIAELCDTAHSLVHGAGEVRRWAADRLALLDGQVKPTE